jgi:hypothetical protein
MHTADLLDRARNMAVAHGIPSIYFVASTPPDRIRVSRTLPNAGYDAITAYNYQAGVPGMYNGKRLSHSYDELANGYVENWNFFLENSGIPYLVPITAGWDKRPWGGSEDAMHDASEGSASEFESHLKEAREIMDKNPERTKKTAIVCCWNEFGEGSYIEPTKSRSFSYLDAVRKIFGQTKR